MTLAEFLVNLREQGVALLSEEGEVPEGNLAAEIATLDRRVREEFPGDAPALRKDVTAWAGGLLRRACLAIVHREVEADLAAQWLARPCPEPASAEVVYSADLVLQHLPQLHQLAQRLSARDPVTASLREFAAQWPHSSVGVAGLAIPPEHPHLPIISGQPGLLRAHADRILERRDLTRVGMHPAIDDALRAALGHHTELAPDFARALEARAANAAPPGT